MDIDKLKSDAEDNAKFLTSYMELKKRIAQEIDSFLSNEYNYLLRSRNESKNCYSSRNNLYVLLQKYSIFNFDSLEKEYNNDILECFVAVPLEDIEIYNGYVIVECNRIEFTKIFTWAKFKLWNKEVNRFMKNYDWEWEMENIFNKRIQTFKKSIGVLDKIRITTYLTAKAFREIFVDNDNRRTQDWNPLNNYHKFPLSFLIPFRYIFNDINNGISILNLIPEWKQEEVLTSDPYTVDEEILKEIILRIKTLRLYGFEEEIKRILSFNEMPEIRCVPDCYKDRIGLTHQIIGDQEKYEILRFKENYRWVSDNVYSRSTKYSITYLAYSEEEAEVQILPTDKKSSIYIFQIDTKRNSVKTAAIILIKYFSSWIENKRENRRIPLVLKEFGIYSMHKVRNSSWY